MTHPVFTLDGYAETVQGIVSRGYSVSDFHQARCDQRHLILRHDVDQSIPRARVLAEREAAEGWRATYFILMRTEMYNPWSRAASEDLRAMVCLGHEIGLHVDATCYADDVSLEAGAHTECGCLEAITGASVRVVSFHRPSRERLRSAQKIAGRIHTYMPKFTQDMGYVSDSRGKWHHGHPWDHSSIQQGGALQLLTHPVWWVSTEVQQPSDRLRTIFEEHSQRLDLELAANSDVWRSLK